MTFIIHFSGYIHSIRAALLAHTQPSTLTICNIRIVDIPFAKHSILYLPLGILVVFSLCIAKCRSAVYVSFVVVVHVAMVAACGITCKKLYVRQKKKIGLYLISVGCSQKISMAQLYLTQCQFQLAFNNPPTNLPENIQSENVRNPFIDYFFIFENSIYAMSPQQTNETLLSII